MSIRTALIGTMLVLAILITGIVGIVGVINIHRSVIREAQARVDHDLDVAVALYDLGLKTLGRQIEIEVASLKWTGESSSAAAQLLQIRQALNLEVLNLCDANGVPIAGAYPRFDVRVPINRDPILREALSGDSASGTMAISGERLELESGAALRNSLAVYSKADSGKRELDSALFQWFAFPIYRSGRVVAAAYGGLALNHNDQMVDTLRDAVFGRELYAGKPLGTVTIFLDGTRVTTNVFGADGRRAIGTQVSEEVHRRVLDHGLRWQDRAWVVDTWYLSAYLPLKEPDGRTVGMVYVGLLEAPYEDVRATLMAQFVIPVCIAFLVGLIASVLIARRIVGPIDSLRKGSERIARGEWEGEISEGRTYLEISKLARVFRQMQIAIRRRDEQLRTQNEVLAETNQQLLQTNDSYMKTLRFVTHELKAPLAAIQSMIDVVVRGTLGSVPQQAGVFLSRIQRNCEELQDMVRDYLELSRAERGELTAQPRRIDILKEIVEPCMEHTDSLFKSRKVELRIACPEGLEVEADPELMRTVLGNYLSNAAKYGREGGQATLEATSLLDQLTVCVWNEGAGFSEEEQEQLFEKFSRLSNDNSKGKRGSGLGLYLCKQIIELHAGRVWAESEPGKWARFCFSIPTGYN